MQQKASDPRMDSMFGTDRLWAFGSVVVLWALYAFVFYAVRPQIEDPNFLWALGGAGVLVVLFNTASILAMISHYKADKEHIYGLDLHYQDIMNKRKV